MRSLYIFLVAALMVLSFSVAGFAQNVSTDRMYEHRTLTSSTSMPSEQRLMTYTGKVVSFNDIDHTLVVNGPQGEKTFDLSQVTTTGTLTPGGDVNVTYHTDMNGNLVASSIGSGGLQNQYGYLGPGQQYGSTGQFSEDQFRQYCSGMGYGSSTDQYGSSMGYGYQG